MALKDHSLDDKITNAARAEFLEHGFLEASLHKIADRAGVTTGALYTRYKNKDALFCSLLEELFEMFKEYSTLSAQKYEAAEESKSAADFLAAMEYEEQRYLDLLFDHYEACVLFYCKSDGSSAEKYLKAMIDHKTATTVEFMERTATQPVDRDAVRLLMEANFHIYRKLMEAGHGKEEATACMKVVQSFLRAGWKEFYERLHAV